MALTTPFLFNIPAFDASDEFTFEYSVFGGSRVYENKLTIKNNETNEIVYSQKMVSVSKQGKYEFKLPAFSLSNGIYYNAVVTTFDSLGNESKPSAPIQFWCYEKPVIKFTNIPIGNLVENSSYRFSFEYNQARGERINSYEVNLYNSSKIKIATSGIEYVVEGDVPFTSDFLFTSLEDSTRYYIEATARTINKTKATTGLIEINVKYSQAKVFSLIELTNNCEEGYIDVKSNVSLIEGESNPSPPKYIANKEVNLTAEGSWVRYTQGYSIGRNFTARVWFREPVRDSLLIKFANTQGQTISIYFRTPNHLKCYIEVVVESVKGKPYYIYSDTIDILPGLKYYNLWLTRINNIYDIKFVKV